MSTLFIPSQRDSASTHTHTHTHSGGLTIHDPTSKTLKRVEGSGWVGSGLGPARSVQFYYYSRYLFFMLGLGDGQGGAQGIPGLQNLTAALHEFDYCSWAVRGDEISVIYVIMRFFGGPGGKRTISFPLGPHRTAFLPGLASSRLCPCVLQQ